MLGPQKTTFASTYRASYGVSFVNICQKTDRAITAPRCMRLVLSFYFTGATANVNDISKNGHCVRKYIQYSI